MLKNVYERKNINMKKKDVLRNISEPVLGFTRVENEEGKKGIINRNGDIIIPCEYDYVTDFSNGLFLCTNCKDTLFQQDLFDEFGKIIIKSEDEICSLPLENDYIFFSTFKDISGFYRKEANEYKKYNFHNSIEIFSNKSETFGNMLLRKVGNNYICKYSNFLGDVNDFLSYINTSLPDKCEIFESLCYFIENDYFDKDIDNNKIAVFHSDEAMFMVTTLY